MTGKLEEAPAIGARVTVTGFRGTVIEPHSDEMRRILRQHPDRVWVRWDHAFDQCMPWGELEELDEDLDDDDDAPGGDS